MALFGLIKSKEERAAEAIFGFVIELKSLMEMHIALVESQFSPHQRHQTAHVAINAVMRSPLTDESGVTMRKLIDQLGKTPDSEPAHLGYSIAFFFIQAWVALGKLPESNRVGLILLLPSMEGSFLGFIERCGLPAWDACYSTDIQKFEATRRRYLANHARVLESKES